MHLCVLKGDLTSNRLAKLHFPFHWLRKVEDRAKRLKDEWRGTTLAIWWPPSDEKERKREEAFAFLRSFKMLDIFRGLKSLIKISHVHIDTAVFRLHYSLTVILLISFSLIVTTRQYVGNPIDCIHSKDLPEDVLNTYCWIHSTYTITAAYRKREGFEVPFPGVDNSKSHPETERKEYRYYQWVCFMLFLQVIDYNFFSSQSSSSSLES